MRKFLVGLGIVIPVLYLGVTYFFSSLILDTPDRDIAAVYQMNKERWGLDLDSLARALPGKTDIVFTSPYDGIELKGWLFEPDTVRCGVVFAHGYSVNRANMLKYTPVFRDCDCALLLYDHRGHGESADAYGTGGYHEATDFIAASDLLRSRFGLPARRIGWFGESWGGATVIQAAARVEDQPAWVVAESPFADWYSAVMERGLKDYGNGLKALTPGAFFWTGLRGGVDFKAVSPVAAVRQIKAPLLLLHSQSDTLTAPVQSDRIAAAAPPELLAYHPLDWGAWHAHNIIWRQEEYRSIVLDFVGDFCD